jgi:hypothetical protein
MATCFRKYCQHPCVISQIPDIVEKIEKLADDTDMEEKDEDYLINITRVLCRDHCINDILKYRPETDSDGTGGTVLRPGANHQHLITVFETMVPSESWKFPVTE